MLSCSEIEFYQLCVSKVYPKRRRLWLAVKVARHQMSTNSSVVFIQNGRNRKPPTSKVSVK